MAAMVIDTRARRIDFCGCDNPLQTKKKKPPVCSGCGYQIFVAWVYGQKGARCSWSGCKATAEWTGREEVGLERVGYCEEHARGVVERMGHTRWMNDSCAEAWARRYGG